MGEDCIKQRRKRVLLAKASTDINQINHKIELGAENIELQLLQKNVDLDKLWQEIGDINIQVQSIHTALSYEEDGRWEEVSLSDLKLFDSYNILDKTCALAERFAMREGHKVIVVLHCDISLKEIKKYELKYISGVLEKLIKKYKKVLICLENISPIRFSPFSFLNGSLFAAAEIAQYYNKELLTNRIGTVLDICHMHMLQNFLNYLHSSNLYMMLPDYSTKAYIEKFSSTLKLIHMNAAVNDGYGEKHGMVAESAIIKEILTLCDKFHCDPFICFEVKEKDYLRSINYEKAVQNFYQSVRE